MGARIILALDLEGTLISNEFSQIPRPGLHDFLAACSSLAPRLVMFTTVPEDRFRLVAQNLVQAGDAPEWFTHLEVVAWNGPKKDLLMINGAKVQDVAMVDDDPDRFAILNQIESWIQVKYFGYPYNDEDTGLKEILPTIQNAFSG